MTKTKITLNVKDIESLRKFHDFWNIFEDFQGLTEPVQVEKDGVLVWQCTCTDEGVAEMLESLDLVEVDRINMVISISELVKNWDDEQIERFKKSQTAFRMIANYIDDRTLGSIQRKIIKEHGRTSPEFYGFNVYLDPERYSQN